MNIRLSDGLPFVTATIDYHGQQLKLTNILLDTGSAGTVFATDKVLAIGLWYDPEDMIHRIRGVGGAEFVFAKHIERLALDELEVNDFQVEIGAMDYGLEIDGIIGIDFLTRVGAIIDFTSLEIRKPML